ALRPRARRAHRRRRAHPAGRGGTRDPGVRGARVRADGGADRDAGAPPRHRPVEQRPGTEVQERPPPPHPHRLLLSLGAQPPVESGPPRRFRGRTSAPPGLRPVCSATSSSSSLSRLARPLIASATGSGRWTQSASGPSGFLPSTRTGWPGFPTTVAPGGTSWITTLLAPIFERSPITIGPSRALPAPIITSSPTVGWGLPRAKPLPPSVTPWEIVTSSPHSALSPITPST